MTITDLVLILFIAALLAFAIYDQFIMPRRNGPTLLAIPLLRRGRIDSVIFVGLIVILIYNNVTNHGALFHTEHQMQQQPLPVLRVHPDDEEAEEIGRAHV